MFVLPSASAQANLVGYWSFDNSTASDLSGNLNHGTVGSNVFFAADTPFGANLAAGTGAGGGSTRVITVPNSTTLQSLNDAMTISFWMKADAAVNADWFRIFQKATEAQYSEGWMVNRYSNSTTMNMRVDTNLNPETLYPGFNQNIGYLEYTPILDNQWHQFLFSMDNGQWSKYVDGVSRGSGTYAHNNGFSNTRDLYMLGRNGAGNYVGLLDDVALWNQSLDAARAMSIYNVPMTLGLPYDMNDMLSLWSIYDEGPGGFGVIDGMPWWYTDELPGTPPAPGGAYVYDDIMYVVLGAGTGVRIPEPSSLLMAMLAVIFLTIRFPRCTR